MVQAVVNPIVKPPTVSRPTYREIIGREIHLNFHSGQSRAWQSIRRFIAMQAGTQGGKTCFGSDWLYREIKTCGEGDYLGVTATFPLLELKMLPEFLTVFRDLLHLGTYSETKKVFNFFNSKTRVIFGSATNPESLESAEAKAAWLDEAGQKQFRRDTWEAVQRRLSIHEGRVLFTTTLYGLGWFKNEIYDLWEEGDPNYDVIMFDSTINPNFPKAEFERMRGRLPAWKFNMFYRGRYDTPGGLIYSSFNPRHCKKPRFEIPKNWLIYVGHDFGPANPAAIFFAEDPATGLLWAFHEYLPGPGKSPAEHVAEFKRITDGYNVVKRVGGSHQEEEARQLYDAHGWPISEPPEMNRKVETQILKVFAWHKLNRIMVFNDLLSYLDEKQSFSRKLDDRYRPTDEIENEAHYHLMAAERYIIADLDEPDRVVEKEEAEAWEF
jgi:hypothetical protein